MTGKVSGEFLTLWTRGARIVAGQCLLSDGPPPPKALVGQRCPHKECAATIVGCDETELAAHQDDHDRRCHV